MDSTRSLSTRSALARATLCALAMGMVACSDTRAAEAPAADQARSADEPWFGVMLPPGFEPHALHVISNRPAAPAVVPEGESQYRELAGDAIQAHLETIVGFSRESEETAEVGEGQIWGRVTGFPSGAKTIEWAVSEFRAAGIADVELQQFDQNEGASIWLPLSWEVRLLGDPAFGEGSADVVLESAMPLSAGDLSGGSLTAPLVYVGTATSAGAGAHRRSWEGGHPEGDPAGPHRLREEPGRTEGSGSPGPWGGRGAHDHRPAGQHASA